MKKPAPAVVACSGKAAFSTFTGAQKVAQRSNRAHDDARLVPYRCKTCMKFHVGDSTDHLIVDRHRIARRKLKEEDLDG